MTYQQSSRNDSTTMLRTMCSRMRRQGWHNGVVLEISLYEGESEPLPRRPLNSGEGLWR